MEIAPAAIVVAILAALSSPLIAGEPPALPPPPPENPLSFADGRIVFSFENQTRFEFRENNYDFDSGVDSINDDAWWLNRFRAGLALKPAGWMTLYFQGQDSREIDSNRPNIPGRLGAEGDDPFDLRQAWVELGNPASGPLTLKAGRQTLLYGDQRLIGPLEWSNISRTFDAVKVRWTGADGLWVDGFVSSVVVPDRSGLDESNTDRLFSGLYAHIPKTGPQDTEVYVLHLNDNDRDDSFLTLGTHWRSSPEALGAWDYESEFAFQTGTVGGRDLTAFAGFLETGYTFAAPGKPRIALEYSYGSGDGNAADHDEGAFQNLYPTNHLHYGFMDLFSWSNLHDGVLHLSAKPCEKTTVGVDVHAFWLADTGDTWRRANATTPVRPVDSAAGSFAGTEADFLCTWAPDPHFSLTVGYSHFFSGSWLRDTGTGSDADFVYVMTGIRF